MTTTRDLLRYSTEALHKFRKTSVTASRLWQARVPFELAMLSVMDGTATPSELVSQLATCYKLDESVAVVPRDMAAHVVDLVQQHVAAQPEDADALFVLVNLHAATMGPTWTVQQLRRCIQLGPGQPAFHRLRGKQLMCMHEYRPAITDFQQALELDPHAHVCLYHLGVCWARLAPHSMLASQQAERALRSFLAAVPKDDASVAPALYELAALSHAAGDLCRMRELFDKGRAAERERLPLFRPLCYKLRDWLADKVALIATRGCRTRHGKSSADQLRESTQHALMVALLIVG